MNFKLRALALAAAALMAGGAQAAINGNATTQENGSLLFVAYDIVGGTNTSLTIDLGIQVADIWQGAALNAPGTSVSWNFNTNQVTGAGSLLDGQTNSWNSNFASFLAVAQSADIRWGVIGADFLSTTGTLGTGGTTRSLLATGNPQAANVTNTTSATALNSAISPLLTGFITASSTVAGQTHTTADNGSNIATSGNAYLNATTAPRNTFGGNLAWQYLVNDNTSSRFQRVEVFGNPTVSQFGVVNTLDGIQSVAADAALFSFNSATGVLTYEIPAAIPEPGTYAMLLAGLGAVGFVARRRRAV